MTENEIRACEFLTKNNIEYAYYEHEAAVTMELCDLIDMKTGAFHCKNLFMTNRQKTLFYLVLMLPHRRFKTSEVSKKLGVSRLSFADDELLFERMGLKPGAVTPLGLLNDLERVINVAVDKALLDFEYICVHPMVSTASLKLKTRELLRFIRILGYEPEFIELTDPDE